MKDKWKGHLCYLMDCGEFEPQNQIDVIHDLYEYIEELERKEKIADAVVKLIEEEIVEYNVDYSMYKYYSERIRTVDDLLKWAEENK